MKKLKDFFRPCIKNENDLSVFVTLICTGVTLAFDILPYCWCMPLGSDVTASELLNFLYSYLPYNYDRKFVNLDFIKKKRCSFSEHQKIIIRQLSIMIKTLAHMVYYLDFLAFLCVPEFL